MTNQEKADYLRALLSALTTPIRLHDGIPTDMGRLKAAVREVLIGTVGESKYRKVQNWYFRPKRIFSIDDFNDFVDFVETSDTALSTFDSFCLIHLHKGMKNY